MFSRLARRELYHLQNQSIRCFGAAPKNPRVFFDITIDGQDAGRIVFEVTSIYNALYIFLKM